MIALKESAVTCRDIWSFVEKAYPAFCENVSVVESWLYLDKEGGVVTTKYYNLTSLVRDDNEEPSDKIFFLDEHESEKMMSEIRKLVKIPEETAELRCHLHPQKELKFILKTSS